MNDDREMSENQYLDEVYGDEDTDLEADAFEDDDDYEPEEEDLEWGEDDDLEEVCDDKNN